MLQEENKSKEKQKRAEGLFHLLLSKETTEQIAVARSPHTHKVPFSIHAGL